MAQPKSKLLASGIGLFFLSLISLPASAGVHAVGAGVSVPRPLGGAAQTLNYPVGFQAEVWLDPLAWMPRSTSFRLSGIYQPYSVRNTTGLGVNLFGAFGGVQLTGGPVLHGITQFMSIEVGGVGTTLTTSGSSSSTTDAQLSFASQAVPGIDIPIYSGLGLVVELPITVVFQKTVLGIWSSVFSLRWRL